MTIDERIQALPDWVDKDLIRKGLKNGSDQAGYMDWIESIVASSDRRIRRMEQ